MAVGYEAKGSEASRRSSLEPTVYGTLQLGAGENGAR